MTVDEFEQTLMDPTPPDGLTRATKALWLIAKNDWDGAHAEVQTSSDPDCAWVHAYLHRKEGDPWNADHWYRRAGRNTSELSLDEEWREILRIQLRRK